MVLGAVTALAALWSLYRPGDVYSEGAHAVLGVLFIIAPWVMGFSRRQRHGDHGLGRRCRHPW